MIMVMHADIHFHDCPGGGCSGYVAIGSNSIPTLGNPMPQFVLNGTKNGGREDLYYYTPDQQTFKFRMKD